MAHLIALMLAGLASGALILGSAAWLRTLLAAEYARGETFGRAASAAEAAVKAFALREAMDASLVKTDADVFALEIERDQLQESLDGLVREVSRAGDGSVCIRPELVRAIGRIGTRRDEPVAGLPPP